MVALPGKTWGEGPGGWWPCPVRLGARDPGTVALPGRTWGEGPGDGGPAR